MFARLGMVAQFVMLDLLGSVVRFPWWWYSEGVMDVVQWMTRTLKYRWRGYAIGLWLRNFFVPMYGAYDWAGRVISLLMRGVVVVARMVALVLETLGLLSLLVAWFFAPVIFLVFLFLNF